MSDKTPARCGTVSGYGAHQRHGEKPCDACALAKKESDARWRSAPERTRKSRMAARAQAKAHTRLIAIYPEIYRVLYAEELRKIQRENEVTA